MGHAARRLRRDFPHIPALAGLTDGTETLIWPDNDGFVGLWSTSLRALLVFIERRLINAEATLRALGMTPFGRRVHGCHSRWETVVLNCTRRRGGGRGDGGGPRVSPALAKSDVTTRPSRRPDLAEPGRASAGTDGCSTAVLIVSMIAVQI